MKKQLNQFFVVFCLLFFSWTAAHTQPSTQNIDVQRKLFLKAEEAYKKKDYEKFKSITASIKTYPLYPYLVYKQLAEQLSPQASRRQPPNAKEIHHFISTFEDSPLADQLYSLWLKHLAAKSDWTRLIREYKPNTHSKFECLYLYANYKTQQNKQFLKQGQKLWVAGVSQAKICDPYFNEMKKQNLISQNMIWQRFEGALSKRNLTLAKETLKYLGDRDKVVANNWYELHQNPTKVTQANFLRHLQTQHPKTTQALTHGLIRYAQKDPKKAYDVFHQLIKQFSFSTSQREQIFQEILIMGALQKLPETKHWFKEIPIRDLTPTAQEWKIRYAISQQDWRGILSAINSADGSVRENENWRYFKARALEGLGNKDQATAIYAQLASSRTYYGFLSSIQLNQKPALRSQIVPTSSSQVKRVSRYPGILRVKELKLLNRRTQARAEWRCLLSHYSELDIIVASRLAQKMGWHDLAIQGISKTNYKDDIPLRFPLAHRDSVLLNAKAQHLHPAWVFGIIRQESAFIEDAASSAGALGLMQLIPETASIMSRKHHIPYAHNHALCDPKLNVRLGALYLKHLFKRMDNNYILTTAAYNAGPGRIPKWLPKKTMDADLWIETIPYYETRNYLQNVLTYIEIYQQLLDKRSILAEVLSPIPGKNLPHTAFKGSHRTYG